MNKANQYRHRKLCRACFSLLFIVILISCGQKEDGQAVFQQGETAYAACDYSNAAQYYLNAAKKGHVEAQVRIANCYWNGQGVERNDRQAIKWYFEAAKQGNAEAWYRIGVCYEEGRGVEKDWEAAARWYQKAADRGHAEALYMVGQGYQLARGVENDYKKAAEYYQKAVEAWREAAEQGNAEAQFRLGDCYHEGRADIKRYEPEAVNWYRKAAEQGHAEAQATLGKYLFEGKYTTKDETEAVKWFRKAAEQSHMAAQFNLGMCYEEGIGVKQDYAEAFKWYHKAAEQGNEKAQSKADSLRGTTRLLDAAERGNVDAMFELAVCFEEGKSFPKNPVEALNWYRKAAEQGNAEAQYRLARAYENEKDDMSAARWYSKAAVQGHAEAQYKLAMAYENGNGVTKDLSEAVKWYRMAAEQGHAGASTRLQTAEMISGAQNGNAEAQYKLAMAYENGNGVTKDLSEAVKWYRMAAEQGHAEAQNKLKTAELILNAQNGNAEAQYTLAQAYERGSGVAKDLTEAIAWYYRAAEQGYVEAQYRLALAYESGTGVGGNLSEAANWYHKAAVQGHLEAQYKLALAYENGIGVRVDFSEAANWYRKAAEQDNAGAQYKLGVYYEKVKTDLSEAANWYRKAVSHGHQEAQSNLKNIELFLDARNGNADAQYKLGLAYEKGEGVEKDTSQAVSWFDLAAKQGHAEAKKAIQKYRLTIELPDGAPPVEMVRVTAGSFMMGATNGESSSKEVPHQATLTCDFYIARTEVTKEQSKAVIGTPRFSVNSNPVDEISWYDAMVFCEKLNRIGKAPSGWKFTLPTETQWEFAACGGYTRIGNVWEWCLDDWNEDSSTQKAEFSRGKGSERDSTFRVNRGGPSFSKANQFAVRSYGRANQEYSGLGFRVALVQDSGNGSDSTTPINNRETRPTGTTVRGTTSSSSTSTSTTTPARQEQVQFDELLLSAQKGSASAQYQLAQAYENGTGVSRNPSEALNWYRKAAKQGAAAAQKNLGFCYQHGIGVSKDLSQAVKWYSKAAEQGIVEAQFQLGMCYFDGIGVSKDEEEAVKWYLKAADQGYAQAQYWLSICYTEGRGVTKNLIRSADWGLKALITTKPAKWLRSRLQPADKTIILSGDVTLDLVKVEAGTFTMSARDGANNPWEVPHQVSLKKDFYLSRTEITQEQWKTVMGANPSEFKGDDLPVEQVSWNDAMSFCEKLNSMKKAPSGWMFTLPTETQWEYAARGGKKSKEYNYSGSNIIDEVAWHESNAGFTTCPVGLLKANELGLYDMSGNVYEWCLDDWNEDSSKQTAEFARGNSQVDSDRVIRGGGWTASDKGCRSGYRSHQNSGERRSNFGFRIALVQTTENGSALPTTINNRETRPTGTTVRGTTSSSSTSTSTTTPARQEQVQFADNTIFLPGNVPLELIKVEAGSFEMSASDGRKQYNEVPHWATLTKDYYIGRTELTQAQWKAVMGTNPSYNEGNDLPVENVSWNDAMEFCEKLNRMGKAPGGWQFTLPTETQWEYAARGGKKSKGYKYSGSDNIDEVAWYYENSGDSRLDDSAWDIDKLNSNHCRMHPVGLKKANELGLYDMNGNVYEWCLDDYKEDNGKQKAEFTRGNDRNGSLRVYRGGSWNSGARLCRSRNYGEYHGRGHTLGFRVALVPVR